MGDLPSRGNVFGTLLLFEMRSAIRKRRAELDPERRSEATGDDVVAALHAIALASGKACRRLRLARAVRWAGHALLLGLVAASMALVLRKTGMVSEWGARALLLSDAALVVLGVALAYARPLARQVGAVALDRHHRLADRLSSALAFGASPAADRTPFMNAAILDAVSHLPTVDARKAVPVRLPGSWPGVVLLAAFVALISLFAVRKHAPTRVAATRFVPAELSADDIDAAREFRDDVNAHLKSPEARAAVEEFNRLVEDLAERRIDHAEAFRRMQKLDEQLAPRRGEDPAVRADALKAMGQELAKSDLSKAVGTALDTGHLSEADKALSALAKRLRESPSSIDKAQLERLRDALKKAAEKTASRAEVLSRRREELKQDLLRERGADAGADSPQRSLLRNKERELARLDQAENEQRSAQRELDKLDRELDKAAQDLMRDMGAAADDLDKAAEDMNRMAREPITREEKEQLRQKIQEMREAMRQQKQAGAGQRQQLQRFVARARGESGGARNARPNDARPGDGKNDKPGEESNGPEGRDKNDAPGREGSQKGESWVLGPSGEKVLLLGKTEAQRASSEGGKKAGHDPGGNVRGKATNPAMDTHDSHVQGANTGQGSSRREVIESAADRGFASRGYQNVYREYKTVAEEALGKDEIPGGYRFYIKRYFQLIRPRDEPSSP
jgi:hypothetical protein